MPIRLLALAWCLTLLGPVPLRGEDFAALAATAAADPTAVVPLVVAASARIRASAPEQGLALAQTIAPACARIYRSPERLPGMEAIGVRVVPAAEVGTRWGLSRRLHIDLAALDWLNAPQARALKAIDAAAAPMSLVVLRSRCLAALWHGPTLVMVLPVAVGTADHPTPLGRTTIATAVADPEWTDPVSHRVFAPHDPGNYLGGYWLGCAPGPDGAFRGIGIHGWTAQDASDWISRPSSHGCLRLKPEDLHVVSALLRPGSVVEIRP